MRKYRAEQIMKWFKIRDNGFPLKRRLVKYLWKNRGEIVFGKDDD